MKKAELQQEALARATGNQTLSNYPTIYQGFIDKGIPEVEIKPRENVFTYNAWQALGRQVMRGEKGVRVTTWIDCKSNNGDGDDDEEPKSYKRPKAATVFHISQTKERDPNYKPKGKRKRGRRKPRHFDNKGHRNSYYDRYGVYTPDGTKIGSTCGCEDYPCCGH